MPEFAPLKPNAASASNPDEAARTSDLPSRTLIRSKVSAVPGTIQWDAPTPQDVDKLFPRLEVQELIGRGGMGAVYKARQLGLDRHIALKLLPAEISQEENFRAKFEREAKTLARLNHPRIITAHDFGITEEKHLYILMEYVEGTDLHTLLNKGPLTPAAAMQVVEDVCEGLAYAHDQGVVHRDVKPANVLIDVSGRAKIVDFGIARLVQPNTAMLGQTTQAVFGTPDYMAPEQFLGAAVDHRVDIYALGIILYEALCRELPRGAVPPPSTRVHVDKRVDHIFEKARQNAPAQRYQSARQMLGELQVARAASGKNGAGANRHRFSRCLPWRRGVHWPWSIAACLIIAALFAAGLSSRNKTAADRTPTVPNTQPPPSPASLPVRGPIEWHDWFVQQPSAIPPTLVKDGDYYTPQIPGGKAGLGVTFGPVMQNLAVRVTYKASQGAVYPVLSLFVHGVGEHPGGEVSYGFVTSNNKDWVLIRHEPPEREKGLGIIPRPTTFDDSSDTTFELRADANLTLLWNGKTQMIERKNRPKPGQGMVYINSMISLRKLEWAKLPD